MYLLCGLGNKGSQYSFTRHNVGYLVVDRFAQRFSISFGKKLSGCRIGTSKEVLLAKPDTYMNLSGGPLSSLMVRYGVSAEDLILVHDDLDMEFGKIRLRWNGRDGGHRGVRSVLDALRSPSFHRMKIGIGRNPLIPPEEYVLSPFSRDETDALPEILDRAVDALHMAVHEGAAKAMSIFNRN